MKQKKLVSKERVIVFMKKSITSFGPAVLLFAIFWGLSLACASAPEPAPRETSKITLLAINQIVKNQEVSLLANNGLTGEQLMEVIKLCISTQELTGVSLVEENAKLSYGVLEANLELSKIPMIVKFSCSISKTGTLKMRVIEVREQNPEVSPFSVKVYTDEYKSICEAYKNLILKKIENTGNTVINRAADFA